MFGSDFARTPTQVLVRQLDDSGRQVGDPGAASLVVTGDAILLTPRGEGRVVVIRLRELLGIATAVQPGLPLSIILHPVAGPPAALTAGEGGDELLRDAASRLESAAFALPELTRGLRAVGSRHGAPGEEHDLWFGQLLAARQRAARADSWDRRLAAFSPAVLATAAGDAVSAAAAARFPDDLPERRALAAALDEVAEPLRSALRELETAAASVRSAPDATRLVAWRGWLEILRSCFARADQGWLAMAPLLQGTR